jgi:hypothetical protein
LEGDDFDAYCASIDNTLLDRSNTANRTSGTNSRGSSNDKSATRFHPSALDTYRKGVKRDASDEIKDDCHVASDAIEVSTSRGNAVGTTTETVAPIYFENDFFVQGLFASTDFSAKRHPALDVQASQEISSYKTCSSIALYSLTVEDLTKLRDERCEAKSKTLSLINSFPMKCDFTSNVTASNATHAEHLKGSKVLSYEVDSLNQATSTFSDFAEFVNPRGNETNQTRDQLKTVLNRTSVGRRETEATMSLNGSTSGFHQLTARTSIFPEGSKNAKIALAKPTRDIGTSTSTNLTSRSTLNAHSEHVQDPRVKEIIRQHTKFFYTVNVLRPDSN